ncbi:MAG: hypothetical protein WC238_04560 [Parcubacteria group bacterium]
MKTVSFELTMPNVGSWNGKWTGASKKYFLIKSFTEAFFTKTIAPLLDGKTSRSWHYSWGDGWGANVELQIVDSKEGKRRSKVSAGFCGYEWMVENIIRTGKIKDQE